MDGAVADGDVQSDDASSGTVDGGFDASMGAGGTSGDASSEASAGGGNTSDAGDADAGDDSAVATYNDPCTDTGSGACLGHAQTRQLVCDGTQWVANGTCPTGTFCDTTPGAGAGLCLRIVPLCDGAAPSDVVCEGTSRLTCGPDLVTTIPLDTCENQACIDGACVGVCAPQSTQCSGNGVQTCDASGEWGTAVACTGQTCSAGACVGVCEPGTRCSGNGVETCAPNGEWSSPVPCSSQACIAGACTGVCAPIETQCSGNGVQSCDASGTWGTVTPCTNQACVNGACTGVCTPADTRCFADVVYTCDSTGQWGSPVACVNQACVGGACVGVCAPGATQCSGNDVQTCDATGQWGTAVRCVSSTCIGGACSGVCAPGATQCSGNDVQTCDATGQWGSAVACSSPLVCGGGACMPAPPNCSGAVVFDDFSGSALDTTTWFTNTSIPQGFASIVQTGGHLELNNRAYLNTVGEFVPAAGGVRVTGKWTFDAAWAFGDFLEVLTRTDGIPQGAGTFGQAQAGLECLATAESSLARVIAWGTTVTNETSNGYFPINLGDTVIFEMTDDGSLVTCAFVNITSGYRATASASSAFAPATNRVSFHNREYETTTNRSLVDNISIESGFVNRPSHHYMFEEATGTTAYDLPGTASGNLAAGAFRTVAVRGAGVSFAGTNDGYVNLGVVGSTLGVSDFTIAFWFAVPSTTHRMDMLGNRANVGDGNFIQVRMNTNGGVEFELDQDVSGTNYHAITGGAGYNDGQWHHLAVRRQGMTLAIFIDGALAVSNTRATGTPTDLSNGAPLRLGSSTIASAADLLTTGTFDDVRIYGTALDDCDVALIAGP